MTKEDKAKEYAKNCYPDNEDMRSQCEYHFESGWDEALKSQWVKVEDALPKLWQEVFAMILYNGRIQIHQDMYIGGEKWHLGNSLVIAWMPIPSFDEILEMNKDVLQRLKDN